MQEQKRIKGLLGAIAGLRSHLGMAGEGDLNLDPLTEFKEEPNLLIESLRQHLLALLMLMWSMADEKFEPRELPQAVQDNMYSDPDVWEKAAKLAMEKLKLSTFLTAWAITKSAEALRRRTDISDPDECRYRLGYAEGVIDQLAHLGECDPVRLKRLRRYWRYEMADYAARTGKRRLAAQMNREAAAEIDADSMDKMIALSRAAWDEFVADVKGEEGAPSTRAAYSNYCDNIPDIDAGRFQRTEILKWHGSTLVGMMLAYWITYDVPTLWGNITKLERIDAQFSPSLFGDSLILLKAIFYLGEGDPREALKTINENTRPNAEVEATGLILLVAAQAHVSLQETTQALEKLRELEAFCQGRSGVDLPLYLGTKFAEQNGFGQLVFLPSTSQS